MIYQICFNRPQAWHNKGSKAWDKELLYCFTLNCITLSFVLVFVCRILHHGIVFSDTGTDVEKFGQLDNDNNMQQKQRKHKSK